MTFRISLPFLAVGMLALPFFSALATGDRIQRIGEPIVHENVAIYFVHGTSALGPVPQTLQEAMAKGTVEVLETGNVQELKIRNLGDEPVFVQFGDIVKGGQQDRVLTVSMLLEPRSGLIPIGAYCVEQGRWAARGKEDSRRFAVSDSQMPSREAKIAMAKPERNAPLEPSAATAGVRRALEGLPVQSGDGRASEQQRQRGMPRADGINTQSEVWHSVGKVQELLTAAIAAPVASETSRTSLQLALENEKLKSAQDAYVAALLPKGDKDADIIGVVVAVNGKLSSADIYPSHGLFKKMWPKLARAAATEALTVKAQTQVGAPSNGGTSPLPTPTVDAVTAFLAEAEKGMARERAIANSAKLESRESEKALRVEIRSASGTLVHRNYLAK